MTTTREENGREREDLKPCPFCGASASIEEIPSPIIGSDRVSFSVGCDSYDEEHCMGFQSLTIFSTRKDAAEAWNRRAS